LRVTLAIAFLALSAVVLLIASSLSMYFSFQSQQKLIINEQRFIAQNAANTVKSFVQEKLSELKATVRFGNLVDASQEEQKIVLEQLLGFDPAFRQLALLNAQNQELAKVSRLSNLVSYGFIKRIGSDTFSQVNEGKRYIGSVYIDETTSEPMVIMVVPVTDIFGDFKGTLIAEVNLKFMWDLVSRIKVSNKGLAYVVDKQGNLIASGDISRVLKGENLIYLKEVNKFVKGDILTHKDSAKVVKGIQGNLVVANHAHLGRPDWAVVVESPVLEAYETVITTLIISVLIMLLSFALAITFGVFLSERIAKPIISLRDAAVRIGEGRLDTQIEIKKKDEIGDLAAAFNQMTENLRRTTTSIDNLNLEIAERKKTEDALRKSEEFTRRVIESSDDCIKVLDLEGHLLSMSEGGQKLLELNDITLYLNSSFIDFWKGKEREDCLEAISKAKQGDTGIFYGYFETAKGTPKWWEIIVTPIKDADGSINRLLAVSRDITDRKKAEETMKRLNRDLESAISKLDRANGELKDFVYIASHDLREPMRKISAFGELLSASLKDELKDDDKENFGFMIDGAKRMQQMIDALLTYSRVTTKGVEFEAVDLNKVVKELSEVELAVKIEESGAKILVPEQLHTVNGDSAQVRQLMQNLIANGLKYQKKGAIPQITISSSTADNDMVRVEVADNGIGIKQEQFKNIFIMFRRLHSRREYEGSGIGLAVCKKIVERHGGDIGVSSTYGEGSTFWFTMLAQKPSEEKQAQLVSSCEAGVGEQQDG